MLDDERSYEKSAIGMGELPVAERHNAATGAQMQAPAVPARSVTSEIELRATVRRMNTQIQALEDAAEQSTVRRAVTGHDVQGSYPRRLSSASRMRTP